MVLLVVGGTGIVARGPSRAPRSHTGASRGHQPNDARYGGRVMVPRAQLRVFAPLEAFEPSERERWSSYVRAGGGLTRREVAETEDEIVAARLLTGRSPLGPQAALVRRAGRRVLVCPLDLELRAAYALATFRRRVPDDVVGSFVPDAGVRDRLEELSATARPPHILDEPWAVPLHWFVAFSPRERHITEPAGASRPRITHLTTCGQAVRRLEEAIEIVEATVEDSEDVLAALAGICAWADAFDPNSLLELDYGRVAALLAPEELREDTTCAQVWEALECLRDGDLLGAAAAYGVVRARWARWRAKQQAS